MTEKLWRCTECSWRGKGSEMLTAPHPFDPDFTVEGCPGCKSIDNFVDLCDEPGCTKDASCGWPAPDGYRRTCLTHVKSLELP